MSWSHDHPALDHRLHTFATYLTDHPDVEGETLDSLADAIDALSQKHTPNEEIPQRPDREVTDHTHELGHSESPQPPSRGEGSESKL